jgi:hypothetical protein
MTTKTCSHCKQTKPLAEFNKCRSHCRTCQSQNSLARRNTIKTFLRKLKALMACIHCGLRDSRLIDFHHVNPDSKCFDLSRAATKRPKLRLSILAPMTM